MAGFIPRRREATAVFRQPLWLGLGLGLEIGLGFRVRAELQGLGWVRLGLERGENFIVWRKSG